MRTRPPIVAVMGHVDHGKTTLLDYIRKTSVAEREAGGITQSIGAYEVTHSGKKITFIDTPGHEAFSNMRTYGAKVADLAILVVAADDGVKPQTKDAIARIEAAKTPFVVAINKIDKPGANVEKAKQDLANAGVYLEGYGGNVSWHAVSAKTGEGISELLDLILLAIEVDPPQEPEGLASGIVMSAKLDPRRGIFVSGVIRGGIVSPTMRVATASASGKIRILEDFLGKGQKSLTSSAPCAIIGFESLPKVGEVFFVGNDEREVLDAAKATAEALKEKTFSEIQENALPLILKADESASLEALEGVVEKLKATYPLHVINASIGTIYEGDVKSAESARAIIIGFRVKTDRAAENVAHAKKVNIVSSPIIYELERSISEYAMKAAARETCTIEVLAVFGVAKGKQRVVGGRVVRGPVKNQSAFEIWNEQRLIGPGKILNLQSGRVDVPEAVEGQEVGLLVESDDPIKVGSLLVFA